MPATAQGTARAALAVLSAVRPRSIRAIDADPASPGAPRAWLTGKVHPRSIALSLGGAADAPGGRSWAPCLRLQRESRVPRWGLDGRGRGALGGGARGRGGDVASPPVSAAVVDVMREVETGSRQPAPENIELTLRRAGL
jgi:hypothetical protein